MESAMKQVVWMMVLMGCGSDHDFIGDAAPPVFDNPVDVEDEERTDRFIQTPPTVVDVLFVIDDSGSMDDEQDQLADNFPSFFNWFLGSGVDYHVGVTSTDMFNPSKMGRLTSAAGVLWIDPDTPNAEAVFTDMAMLGTDGDGTESGIAAAYSALELRKDGYNEGFLREEGSLQVVLISDEQDQSGNDPITRVEFVEFLVALEGEKEEVGFSSIVTPPGVWGPGGETPGTNYLWVTHKVGGKQFDIRESNWSGLLDQLGLEALGLEREFFLSQLPVVDTIEVSEVVDGITQVFEVEDEWFYDADRNSVTFTSHIPDPYAEILIHYTTRAAVNRAP